MSIRIPISVVILFTFAMFVALTLGSFLPTLLTGRNTAEDLTSEIADNAGRGIITRIRGAIDLMLMASSSTATAFNSLPPAHEVQKMFLELILISGGMIDFVQMATYDGTYYSYKLGELGEPYQFNVRNASYPCRTDFNMTVDEAKMTSEHQNILNTFCNFNPMEERWVANANGSHDVRVSTVLPRFGLKYPPSSLSFGLQINDQNDVPFGVFAVEYSLDEISQVLHGLKYQGGSGAAVFDARNGQYLAGSWLTNEHSNNPLYDTTPYKMTDQHPTILYNYWDTELPADHKLNHPLLEACLHQGNSGSVKTSGVIDSLQHYITADGNVQCVVQDVIHERLDGLHLRMVVFVDRGSYLSGILSTQRTIIVVIVIIFVLIAVLQAGLLSEMTRSINNMGAVVHETMTQSAKRSGERTVRTSAIREIAIMQEKLEQFGTTMNQYVPGEVVAELLLSGRSAEVFMTPTNAVILFVDIESFTTLCEGMDTEDLSDLLLHYYDVQCGTLNAHGGVIDKYIGDCIMCLWNAPTAIDNAETRAVCAALHLRDNMKHKESQAFLHQLNVSRLEVRVGIAKGVVLAGNMGSSQRLSYTVLGDPVNLASRLEAANKKFHTRILVNGDVMTGTMEQDDYSPFVYRDLGTVQVYGKNISERVFQIIGVRSEACSEKQSHCTSSVGHGDALSERTIEVTSTVGGKSQHKMRRYDTSCSATIKTTRSSTRRSSCSSTSLTPEMIAALAEMRAANTKNIWGIGKVLAEAAHLFSVKADLVAASDSFNRGVNSLLSSDFGAANDSLLEASAQFGDADQICSMMFEKMATLSPSSNLGPISPNGGSPTGANELDAKNNVVMFHLGSK